MTRRFKLRTTISRQAPGRWCVPPHLRGLACQVCGYFFQDGETHGELNLETGELTCKARTLKVSNRPSHALVKV